MNLGAGRVVLQDLPRIDDEVATGAIARNKALLEFVAKTKAAGGAVHLMGLLSPGGVHSHQDHMAALAKIFAAAGLKVWVHALLDGRDTPPRSADGYLAKFSADIAGLKNVAYGVISGRYYAMDRDKRWERVQPAYDLVTQGAAPYSADTAVAGLKAAYARDESDEFVKPTAVGEPVRMNDGDAVVFMNFRADRARQMTAALTDDAFRGFERAHRPRLGYFCALTRYGDDFADIPAAFAPQSIANGFGQYIASRGLRQLRIAETEKYAHVTYFFNGGVEAPYPGEDRILVPSPKVATYDLKPEMSAYEVTDRLVEAIRSGRYHAIICNYANGDMVGHTGNLAAATRAVEVLDECLGRVVTAMQEAGGEVIVTADHGNAETMMDPQTQQAHTAHTLNLVPFLYVGRKARVADGGALEDVAPTLLAAMGLPQPPEMTGRSLITLA